MPKTRATKKTVRARAATMTIDQEEKAFFTIWLMLTTNPGFLLRLPGTYPPPPEGTPDPMEADPAIVTLVNQIDTVGIEADNVVALIRSLTLEPAGNGQSFADVLAMTCDVFQGLSPTIVATYAQSGPPCPRGANAILDTLYP